MLRSSALAPAQPGSGGNRLLPALGAFGSTSENAPPVTQDWTGSVTSPILKTPLPWRNRMLKEGRSPKTHFSNMLFMTQNA